MTHLWQLKVLNGVMYGKVLGHEGTHSYTHIHTLQFECESLMSANLRGSWEVIATVQALKRKMYCIYSTVQESIDYIGISIRYVTGNLEMNILYFMEF